MKIWFIRIMLSVMLSLCGILLLNIFVCKGYYWPRITTCRSCEKSIFAWESYEVRTYAADVANPDDLPLCVSTFRGCVHKNCPAPKPIKMTVKAHTLPNGEFGFGASFNDGKGAVLYPKEGFDLQLDNSKLGEWLMRFFKQTEVSEIDTI